jgi:hypothetical protein
LHAQQATRGFKANQIVESRGHSSTACRIRSEREAHQTRRHRDRCSGACSSGDITMVINAGAGSVGRTRTCQPGGKLIEICLSDGDGPCFPQRAHHSRVAARRVCICRTTCRSRESREINVVLYRERYTVKRKRGGKRIVVQFTASRQGRLTWNQRNPDRSEPTGLDPAVNFVDDVEWPRGARFIQLSQRAQVQRNAGHHEAAFSRGTAPATLGRIGQVMTLEGTLTVIETRLRRISAGDIRNSENLTRFCTCNPGEPGRRQDAGCLERSQRIFAQGAKALTMERVWHDEQAIDQTIVSIAPIRNPPQSLKETFALPQYQRMCSCAHPERRPHSCGAGCRASIWRRISQGRLTLTFADCFGVH